MWKREAETQSQRDSIWEILDRPLLVLKMKRDCEPRNSGSLGKLEKARKWILPSSPCKGTQTCQNLDFSSGRHMLDVWPPKLQDNKCVVEATTFMVCCYRSIRKLIQIMVLPSEFQVSSSFYTCKTNVLGSLEVLSISRCITKGNRKQTLLWLLKTPKTPTLKKPQIKNGCDLK